MRRNRRFQRFHAIQPKSAYRHFRMKRVSHEPSERNANSGLSVLTSPPASLSAVDFPKCVSDLIKGTFGAIGDASRDDALARRVPSRVPMVRSG